MKFFLYVFSFIMISSSAFSQTEKVLYGDQEEITAHSQCKVIANEHASGQAIMAPLATSTEWSAFLSNTPSGVYKCNCTHFYEDGTCYTKEATNIYSDHWANGSVSISDSNLSYIYDNDGVYSYTNINDTQGGCSPGSWYGGNAYIIADFGTRANATYKIRLRITHGALDDCSSFGTTDKVLARVLAHPSSGTTPSDGGSGYNLNNKFYEQIGPVSSGDSGWMTLTYTLDTRYIFVRLASGGVYDSGYANVYIDYIRREAP